jgi:Ca2+-binding RTX toxin-like protein
LGLPVLLLLASPTHASEPGPWTKVVGTPEGERIHTGDGRQRIFAKGGDDRISSGFDADVVHGGLGDDVIWSGPDEDEGEHAYGGAGDDRLHDQDGRDPSEAAVLDGGPGHDICTGYPGSTTFVSCEVIHDAS